VPGLTHVFLDCAAAAFSDLLPAGHPLPNADHVARRTLESMGTDGVELTVAEHGAKLVGYVGFGWSRDPDALPGIAEVWSMFVHPSAWRGGVGSRLMENAMDGLRAAGHGEVTLWSFLANERANAFYESCGMTRDGARRREAVWADVDQVRYRRSL